MAGRQRSPSRASSPTSIIPTPARASCATRGRLRAAMPLSDSARPPVLAHQRFVADRAGFAQLNLRERFQRIHDTNLWGAEASVSGLGSELDATATLRTELPALLRRLQVASLLDAPCGDAGWILRADLGVRIVGVDIVP